MKDKTPLDMGGYATAGYVSENMAVQKIQTKDVLFVVHEKPWINQEILQTQALDVTSVRITQLYVVENLRKREYLRDILSIYGEYIWGGVWINHDVVR